MTEPDPASRPALVSAAAVVLLVVGGGLVATSVADLAGLAGALLAEVRDSVDGIAAVVTVIVGGIAAALILAAALIGGLEVLVAVRMWQRVRWAWIEAIVISLVALPVAVIGLADPPMADAAPLARVLQPAWGGAAIVGHIFVFVAVVANRPWFGRLGWPRSDEEAPFWLRRDRFP
ncbi:MAG TPA: hypothetical protein VGQ58_09815 [Candidatus Limnocylindrales bacterium]|nr:hypothetical protein [Candidatus Limnocylindrales bacterium]